MSFTFIGGIPRMVQIYADKSSKMNVEIDRCLDSDYAFRCKKCGDCEDHGFYGDNAYIDLDLLKIFCDNHKHEVPSWDNVKTFVHDQKEPLKNDVHYRLTLGVSKPPHIELPIELPEVAGRRFRGVK
jgi:hypothetical protein